MCIAQQVPLSSCCKCKCFSLGFHIQRLVRAPAVVKAYPVVDHAAGLLQGFKLMPVAALLF